jgi:hypothetical protein
MAIGTRSGRPDTLITVIVVKEPVDVEGNYGPGDYCHDGVCSDSMEDRRYRGWHASSRDDGDDDSPILSTFLMATSHLLL